MLALSKRLSLPRLAGETTEEFLLRMPTHVTHVHVCPCCRRVANALCEPAGKKKVAFNELGLSASMLHTSKNGPVMRCAKRASASLRGAATMEVAASEAVVEELPALEAELPEDLSPASCTTCTGRAATTATSKLRRDIKSAFEQQPNAIVCGTTDLVTIPVVGKVVRVAGSGWVALCSICGSLTKVANATERCGGEICCNRCDFGLLHGAAAAKEVEEFMPKPKQNSCRFCGKVQPLGTTGRWRTLDAPLDDSGPNAGVPEPLRVATFCPSHHKTWLANALLQMPTREIFAHLLAKARPIFGAKKTAKGRMNVSKAAFNPDDPLKQPVKKRTRAGKRKEALTKRLAQSNRKAQTLSYRPSKRSRGAGADTLV